jgi:hypothetical protein
LTAAAEKLLGRISDSEHRYKLINTLFKHISYTAAQDSSTNRELDFYSTPSKVGDLILRLRLSHGTDNGVLAVANTGISWTEDASAQEILEVRVASTSPAVSTLTILFHGAPAGIHYVIDVADLRTHPTCILNNVYDLLVKEMGSCTAITTTVNQFTFSQFSVVYRAISDLPIHLSMLHAGREVLDFFGILKEPLLVRNAELHMMPMLATRDIIIGGKDEGIDMGDTAKALRLPYVRFHVKFSDGEVSYMPNGCDGEDREGAEPVHVQPVWLSIGDYHNVAAMMHISTSHRYFAMTGVQMLNEGLLDARGRRNAAGLEYAVGLPESYVPKDMWDHIGEKISDEEPVSAIAPLHWPGGADCPEEQQITPPNGRLFHIDSAGNTCWSPAEGVATMNRLKKLQIIEKVKAALLVKIPCFATPQRSTNAELSLLTISFDGIVRLGN